MPSEKDLLDRIERLEKQVSDLSLALGGFAVGTYNGYLMTYPRRRQQRPLACRQSHEDGEAALHGGWAR